MMSRENIIQSVRGTHDLLGMDVLRFNKIIAIFRGVATTYGFSEIIVPIFEFSEVFHRLLGATSDVVSKETYDFKDRGDNSLTLRPELTAGIVRSVISNKISDLPAKFYSYGPAFRYERPQKGRMRQFNQVNVELFGVELPQSDIELIACAYDFLAALGLGKRVLLKLNSLGDNESRTAYREALIAYFRQHKDKLSTDSQRRLEYNPLRILDSKDDGDRELLINAPLLPDYLTPLARDFFNIVTTGLSALNIDFVHDPFLVRGLDYYNHTIWEFTTTDIGSQGAVLSGGRYNGMVKAMGGADIAGIGWAAGVERLALMIDFVQQMRMAIAIIAIGDTALLPAMIIARELRQAGFIVEQPYSGKIGKRLEKIARQKIPYALLLGDEEITNNIIICRNLETGKEKRIEIERLVTELKLMTDKS